MPIRPRPGSLTAGRRMSRPATRLKRFTSSPSTQPSLRPSSPHRLPSPPAPVPGPPDVEADDEPQEIHLEPFDPAELEAEQPPQARLHAGAVFGLTGTGTGVE